MSETPTPAAIEAAQIIPPRFITNLIALSPTFSARVPIEENLRADIVSAIECARREGWEAGRDAAAMAAKNGPVTGTWRERRMAIVEAIRALTPPSQGDNNG